MWNMKISGPDADDLIWLDLSDPEKGSVAFSVPADSVRGKSFGALSKIFRTVSPRRPWLEFSSHSRQERLTSF
jgi:hypothetical protein